MNQGSFNCEIFEENGKLTNSAWKWNAQISKLWKQLFFFSLSVMKHALCY